MGHRRRAGRYGILDNAPNSICAFDIVAKTFVCDAQNVTYQTDGSTGNGGQQMGSLHVELDASSGMTEWVTEASGQPYYIQLQGTPTYQCLFHEPAGAVDESSAPEDGTIVLDYPDGTKSVVCGQ